MDSVIVNAIAMVGRNASQGVPSASAMPQQTGPHWTEQSVSRDDKTRMAQLSQSAPVARAELPPQPVTGLPNDMLGHKALFAALDKLRNTPADRMPVAAAELMVQCYEYQFNVTAVTHAAKNFEESVQTMTTRT